MEITKVTFAAFIGAILAVTIGYSVLVAYYFYYKTPAKQRAIQQLVKTALALTAAVVAGIGSAWVSDLMTAKSSEIHPLFWGGGFDATTLVAFLASFLATGTALLAVFRLVLKGKLRPPKEPRWYDLDVK